MSKHIFFLLKLSGNYGVCMENTGFEFSVDFGILCKCCVLIELTALFNLIMFIQWEDILPCIYIPIL